MKRRGLGLGTTLVVVALVATLGFLVTQASISHVQSMSRTANAGYALDLARSALNLAVERVFSDDKFGTQTERVLEVRLDGAPEGSLALVNFDPGRTDVPLSLNNLHGDGSQTTPAGQVVPLQAAYIVAEGRCRGVTRRVEAVLCTPPFPFAAASDGPISSSGGLLVGSRTSSSAGPVSAKDLEPADLLSNEDGTHAIALGPDSLIKGNLQACGDIVLDAGGGTTVEGQLLPHQNPREIPQLRAEDYDPGPTASTPSELYEGDTTFTGRVKSTGDVHVRGDLELKGALLYVQGDLVVDGSLKGTGIVVTTRGLRVAGQTEMQSADKVALISKGPVQLSGRGQASSNLRGVVYSEGGLTAHQLRLEGALISRGQAGPVRLDEVSLLRDPTSSRVQVSLQQQTVSLPKSYPTDLYIDHTGRTFTSNQEAAVYPYDYFHFMPHQDPFKLNDPTAVEVWICKDYQFNFSSNGYFNHTYHFSLNDLVTGSPEVDKLLADLNQPLRTTGPNEKVWTLTDLAKLMGVSVLASDPGETTPTPGSVVTVDPSELLPLSERARIVLWRER